MKTLLAGDIGGTKTILRLVKTESTGLIQQLVKEEIYVSREFPDLVPMVSQFLSKESKKPEKACFGIAGPVENNSCQLTNLNWSLEGERLERELDLKKVSLINDFAAVGYGILTLASEDIYTLQEGKKNPKAPIAIIGAGTGLGQGFIVPINDHDYRVFPSEGSHGDFAPRSALEFDLLAYLKEKLSLDRISVERVVSGMGIASIYQFLRDRYPEEESPEMLQIYETWSAEINEKTIDLSAQVAKRASLDQDYLCEKTMKLFMENYGAETGNLALKLLPYGGIYIAGGIVTKNLNLIKQGEFLRAFSQKGRMTSLMENFPIHVILNPKVGLMGAAFVATKYL